MKRLNKIEINLKIYSLSNKPIVHVKNKKWFAFSGNPHYTYMKHFFIVLETFFSSLSCHANTLTLEFAFYFRKTENEFITDPISDRTHRSAPNPKLQIYKRYEYLIILTRSFPNDPKASVLGSEPV